MNSAIANMVVRYYGITYEDLISPSREEKYVIPRQMTCYLMHEHGIMRWYIENTVNRSRGAVYNAIRKMSNLLDYSADLRLDIVKLRQFISHPETFRKKNFVCNVEPIKHIYQYDKDGNLIGKYRTVKEASENTGVSLTTIRRGLKSYKKLSKGYYWKLK